MKIILDYLVLIIWACLMPLTIIRLVGHRYIKFFRKIGKLSVFLYLTFWILCAILIFLNGTAFLAGKVFKTNIVIIVIGITIFSIGAFLLNSGRKILGIKTFFGIPEILPKSQSVQLTTEGLFSLVRHPIYLGNLLLIAGAFLITAELSLFILFSISIILIWPITSLEERELIDRFGEAYRTYQKKVPRILPKIRI